MACVVVVAGDVPANGSMGQDENRAVLDGRNYAKRGPARLCPGYVCHCKNGIHDVTGERAAKRATPIHAGILVLYR